MLRLLTDQLGVYISIDQITLVRERGIFHRHLVSKHVQKLRPLNSDQPWQACVSALRHLLIQPEWKCLRARIFLSSDYVKYRVSEKNDHLSIKERALLAQHQFNEVFGESINHSSVHISSTEFGKNEIVCAVPKDFLVAMQVLFSLASYKLNSIEPFLIVALNACRKSILQDAWIIVIEGKVVHFAQITKDGWKNVRTKAIQSPLSELNLLFQRELLRSDNCALPEQVCFFWPENPEFVPSIDGCENINILKIPSFKGFSNKNDAEFSMAVCVS